MLSNVTDRCQKYISVILERHGRRRDTTAVQCIAAALSPPLVDFITPLPPPHFELEHGIGQGPRYVRIYIDIRHRRVVIPVY